MTGHELGAICESAYHPHGGATYIHYFLVTPMANPEYCVPRQFASSRQVRPGDVIATEITAQFFDYPGQIVTETGFERMHRAERGLFRVG
ncbi:MAG: hypothetical protein DMG78_32855 [Acidobacteria bacterium]|nr:MAG: hypothetical protein DMG78_32855 [Acidobacteriota bacterium]